MGIYSTAHLVYGWRVPSDTWLLVDDLTEHLEERLEGGPLGFYLDGGFEWSDEERDLIITIKAAPSFSACESTYDIDQRDLDLEVTGALDRELRKEAKGRLGITLEGNPKWHLGCTIG